MRSTLTDAPRRADFQERIRRIFERDLKVEVPSAETDLFEAGVLDSLAFVELLVRIEEEFGLKVSLDALELADFRSIETIAMLLARDGGAK